MNSTPPIQSPIATKAINSHLRKRMVSENRDKTRAGRIRLEIGLAVTVTAISIICKKNKNNTKGSEISIMKKGEVKGTRRKKRRTKIKELTFGRGGEAEEPPGRRVSGFTGGEHRHRHGGGGSGCGEGLHFRLIYA